VDAEGDVDPGEDDRGNDQGDEKDFQISSFHFRDPPVGSMNRLRDDLLQSVYPEKREDNSLK
jgi:hypothetical protein